MTDINKQIEEEAREYATKKLIYPPLLVANARMKIAVSNVTFNAYKSGYESALHSSRWRKVSEGLPEYSVDVLCKYDSGTLFIGYLSKVDNAFRVANTHYNVIREVIEWKYID